MKHQVNYAITGGHTYVYRFDRANVMEVLEQVFRQCDRGCFPKVVANAIRLRILNVIAGK